MENGYKALEKQYGKVDSASAEMFAKQRALLEQTISSSFAAYFSLVKNTRLDERQQHLAAFFYRNSIYLSGAYQLLCKGMLDPAGNNMRTIFETIIWQYGYLLDDEVYSNFKEITALENEKISLLPQEKWSNTKERNLQNLRRKYSFQKLMKQLYSKELYEKFFFNQYWLLCQRSHSSLFALNYNTPSMEGKTITDKNPKELLGNFTALLYLSAENLVCFLNCFSKQLTSQDVASSLDFINRLNGSLSPAPSLVPDTKQLEFTIRIKQVDQ